MSNNVEGDLKPEHLRALTFLEENLDKVPLLDPSEISREILNTNAFQLFSRRFPSKDIPNESHWRWNQTKSRKSTMLTSWNAHVSIFKSIPRKRNSLVSTKLPAIKLWQFYIQFQSEKSFHALWCERGLAGPTALGNEMRILNESKTPELSIADLSFLSEFMPQETAKEFWPNLFTD